MTSDEKVEAIASKSQQIIRDFGALVEKVDGTKFYDEKLLPHDKATIFSAMQISYAMSEEAGRSVLRAGVISLANFQPDIGPEPVGFALGDLDPSKIDNTNLGEAIALSEHWRSLQDTASREIEVFQQKLRQIGTESDAFDDGARSTGKAEPAPTAVAKNESARAGQDTFKRNNTAAEWQDKAAAKAEPQKESGFNGGDGCLLVFGCLGAGVAAYYGVAALFQ